MGLVEIGIGVLVVVVVVVGVLFYSLAHQRTGIDESKSPSLPPKRDAAAPGAGASTNVVVHLRGGEALAEQLRAHANTAENQGLRPFFEVGAIWCPPSKLFGDSLADPRMEAALAGVYLIRADVDEFSGDPLLRKLGVTSVPVFFELDAQGQSTGHSMTGDAWGADTIENMSAAMAKFCG